MNQIYTLADAPAAMGIAGLGFAISVASGYGRKDGMAVQKSVVWCALVSMRECRTVMRMG